MIIGIKNRNCHSGGPLRENKRKGKEKQILEPCWRTKKLWNKKLTVILVVIGALGTFLRGLVRRLEELEFGGRDYPNFSILK